MLPIYIGDSTIISMSEYFIVAISSSTSYCEVTVLVHLEILFFSMKYIYICFVHVDVLAHIHTHTACT